MALKVQEEEMARRLCKLWVLPKALIDASLIPSSYILYPVTWESIKVHSLKMQSLKSNREEIGGFDSTRIFVVAHAAKLSINVPKKAKTINNTLIRTTKMKLIIK